MSKENQILFHFLSELIGNISPEEIKRNERLVMKAKHLFKQLAMN